MRVVSFVTQKGGSGKSTTAASIAVAAFQQGRRVFMLELDPANEGFNANEVTFSNSYDAPIGPIANSVNPPGTIINIADVTLTAQPPIVLPDFAHATYGTTTNVAAAGVLTNDTPAVTVDTLTVSAVDGLSQNVGTAVAGAYGTLTLDADGSYTYKASGHSALPLSGVSEDFFGYTALEGGQYGGGSASSTLTVVVTAPGLAYVAGGCAAMTR